MIRFFSALALGLLLAVPAAQAQEAHALTLTVKNKQFQPRELTAPANVPIMLTVKNNDATAMEFESVSLRVEKVVTANGSGTIRIRPLSPGRYNFFDDFNQAATGILVVK
jgi:hypothetical protein